MKKYFIVISILIVIFISACKTQEATNKIQDEKEINQADWLTYKSSKFSFEFQYPQDWNVSSRIIEAD